MIPAVSLTNMSQVLGNLGQVDFQGNKKLLCEENSYLETVPMAGMNKKQKQKLKSKKSSKHKRKNKKSKNKNKTKDIDIEMNAKQLSNNEIEAFNNSNANNSIVSNQSNAKYVSNASNNNSNANNSNDNSSRANSKSKPKYKYNYIDTISSKNDNLAKVLPSLETNFANVESKQPKSLQQLITKSKNQKVSMDGTTKTKLS